jgi:predicted nucleotidyltransferase component of viral defense system/DNA-directed RNA polymerase subunit RPC12/RpoP
MIYTELEEIVNNGQKNNLYPLYIRSLLKEYLQLYLLYFIYTTTPYKDNFIFTGGTCLRHFYGLERLSEDIDFDIYDQVDSYQLKNDIENFFKQKYFFSNLNISVKQKGRQILLKFPILHKLKLAQESESDYLYLKIDLSPLFPKSYQVISEAKSIFGLNFVAKHYDLPTLMANKIYAIFNRLVLKGVESKKTIKGRDYFDLLWFLKKGVKLNLKRYQALSGNFQLQLQEIEKLLDKKIDDLNKKFLTDFELDLLPFTSDSHFIKSYVKNYQEEYQRNKGKSFNDMVNLKIKCQNCKKEFNTGIISSKKGFETSLFVKNIYHCPFCQHKNIVDKKDYLLE